MGRLPTAKCDVCDQALPAPRAQCGNPVCTWPDRQFEWNFAVAMRHGELQAAINDYKYNSIQGWAIIFGRVLAGFLHEHRSTFEDFDLVIPSPTYVGPGGRTFNHTATVLREAAKLDETGLRFVIDSPVIEKTGPTKKLVDCSGWAERRYVCEYDLPRVLKIPDRAGVAGKAVLVYDDVFTDGLNINAIAKKLREAGAEVVCQISLARQPWQR